MIILTVINVLIVGIVKADVSELFTTNHNYQNYGYHYQKPILSFATPKSQFNHFNPIIKNNDATLFSSYGNLISTPTATTYSKGLFIPNIIHNNHNNNNNNNHNNNNNNNNNNDDNENVVKVVPKSEISRTIVDSNTYGNSNSFYNSDDKNEPFTFTEKYKDSYETFKSDLLKFNISKANDQNYQQTFLPNQIKPNYTRNDHDSENNRLYRTTVVPQTTMPFLDNFENSAKYELLKPLVNSKYDKIKQDTRVSVNLDKNVKTEKYDASNKLLQNAFVPVNSEISGGNNRYASQLTQKSIITTYRPSINLSNQLSNEKLQRETFNSIKNVNNVFKPLSSKQIPVTTTTPVEMIKTSSYSKVTFTTSKPVTSINSNKETLSPTVINSLDYNNRQEYLPPFNFVNEKPKTFASNINDNFGIVGKTSIEAPKQTITTSELYSPQLFSQLNTTTKSIPVYKDFKPIHGSLHNEYLPPSSTKGILSAEQINEQLPFNEQPNKSALEISNFTLSAQSAETSSTTFKPIKTFDNSEKTSTINLNDLKMINQLDNVENDKSLIDLQKLQNTYSTQPSNVSSQSAAVNNNKYLPPEVKPLTLIKKSEFASLTTPQKTDYFSTNINAPNTPSTTGAPLVSLETDFQAINNKLLPPDLKVVGSTTQLIFASLATTQKPEYFSRSSNKFSTPYNGITTTTLKTTADQIENNNYLPPEIKPVGFSKTPAFGTSLEPQQQNYLLADIPTTKTLKSVLPQIINNEYLPPDIKEEGSTAKSASVSSFTPQNSDYFSASASTTITPFTTTIKPVGPQITSNEYLPPDTKPVGSTEKPVFVPLITPQKPDYFSKSTSKTYTTSTTTTTLKPFGPQKTSNEYLPPDRKPVGSTEKPVFVPLITPQKPDYFSKTTSTTYTPSTTTTTLRPNVPQLTNNKYLPPDTKPVGSTEKPVFVPLITPQKPDYFAKTTSTTYTPSTTTTTLKPVGPQITSNEYLPPDTKPVGSTEKPVFVPLITPQKPDYFSKSTSTTYTPSTTTTTLRPNVPQLTNNKYLPPDTKPVGSTEKPVFVPLITPQKPDNFSKTTSTTYTPSTTTTTLRPNVPQLTNNKYLPPDTKPVGSTEKPVFVPLITPQKPDYFSKTTSTTYTPSTTTTTLRPNVPQLTNNKYLPPDTKPVGSTEKPVFVPLITPQKPDYFSKTTSTTYTPSTTTTTLRPNVPQLTNNKYLPPDTKPVGSTEKPVFVPLITPQKPDYFAKTTSTTYTPSTTTTTLKPVGPQITSNEYLPPNIKSVGSTKQPVLEPSIIPQKPDYFSKTTSKAYTTSTTTTTLKPIVPQISNNKYLPPDTEPVGSTEKPVLVPSITPQKPDYFSITTSKTYTPSTTTTTLKPVVPQIANNKYLPPDTKSVGSTKQPVLEPSITPQKLDSFSTTTSKTYIPSTTTTTGESVVPQITNNKYLPPDTKPVGSAEKSVIAPSITPQKLDYVSTTISTMYKPSTTTTTLKPVSLQITNNKYLPPDIKSVASTKKPVLASSTISQKPDYISTSRSATRTPSRTTANLKPVVPQITNNKYLPPDIKSVAPTKKPMLASSSISQKANYISPNRSATRTPSRTTTTLKPVAPQITNNKYLPPDIKSVASTKKPVLASSTISQKPDFISPSRTVTRTPSRTTTTLKPVASEITNNKYLPPDASRGKRPLLRTSTRRVISTTSTSPKSITTKITNNKYLPPERKITRSRKKSTFTDNNNKYLPPKKDSTTKSTNRSPTKQKRPATTLKPTKTIQILDNENKKDLSPHSTRQPNNFAYNNQRIESSTLNPAVESVKTPSKANFATQKQTSVQHKQQVTRYEIPERNGQTPSLKNNSKSVNSVRTANKSKTPYTIPEASVSKKLDNKYLPPVRKRITSTLKPENNNNLKFSATTKLSSTTVKPTFSANSKAALTPEKSLPKLLDTTPKEIIKQKPISHAILNNEYLPPVSKVPLKPLIKPESEEYLPPKYTPHNNVHQLITTLKPTEDLIFSNKLLSAEKSDASEFIPKTTTPKSIINTTQKSLINLQQYSTESAQITGYFYPNNPVPPFVY